MTDPEDHAFNDVRDDAAAARRIGEAARDARHYLDDIDDTPRPEMNTLEYMQAAAGLEVILRQLLDAIDAVTADNRTEDKDRPSTATEREFIAAAGMNPNPACDERRRVEDWLVWSAIKTDHERARLDPLIEMTAVDIIPGLREVLEAVPADYSDLGTFTVLRSPMEELGGLTPTQWLLLGGDTDTVRSLIQDLTYDP